MECARPSDSEIERVRTASPFEKPPPLPAIYRAANALPSPRSPDCERRGPRSQRRGFELSGDSRLRWTVAPKLHSTAAQDFNLDTTRWRRPCHVPFLLDAKSLPMRNPLRQRNVFLYLFAAESRGDESSLASPPASHLRVLSHRTVVEDNQRYTLRCGRAARAATRHPLRQPCHWDHQKNDRCGGLSL